MVSFALAAGNDDRPTSASATAIDSTLTATQPPTPPCALPLTSTTCLPTPYFHPYVLFESGRFWMPPWDDREIGDEQKLADPLYDPAWLPLSDCLAAGGLEVRPDPTTKYNLQDVNRMLERVNLENPNKDQNLKGPPPSGSSAAVFLRCANEWLNRSRDEIEKLTGVTEARPK